MLSTMAVVSCEVIVDASNVSHVQLKSLMAMVQQAGLGSNAMDCFDSNLPDDFHLATVVDVNVTKMLHLAPEAMIDSTMTSSMTYFPMVIESHSNYAEMMVCD